MSEELIMNPTPGRPFGTTTYDEAIHVKLLHDTFTNGEGVMAFCADAGINRRTFSRWVKQHESFKNAYDVVINMAGRLWERLPLEMANDGKPFNYQYWHLIMRNRFHYSGLNIPKSKNKTTEGKFKSAWKGLEQGSLNSQDYSQIMGGIVNELRAKELELKNKELELRQKELNIQESDILGLPKEILEIIVKAIETERTKKAGG